MKLSLQDCQLLKTHIDEVCANLKMVEKLLIYKNVDNNQHFSLNFSSNQFTAAIAPGAEMSVTFSVLIKKTHKTEIFLN